MISSVIPLFLIVVFLIVFNLMAARDRDRSDYTVYTMTNFSRLVGWMLLDALLASILYILWFPF